MQPKKLYVNKIITKCPFRGREKADSIVGERNIFAKFYSEHKNIPNVSSAFYSSIWCRCALFVSVFKLWHWLKQSLSKVISTMLCQCLGSMGTENLRKKETAIQYSLDRWFSDSIRWDCESRDFELIFVKKNLVCTFISSSKLLERSIDAQERLNSKKKVLANKSAFTRLT